MMPAYNFKAAFADAVKSGKKRQTIRRKRKRRTNVGEILQLYTGMRRKNCRLLRKERCRAVDQIVIEAASLIYLNDWLLFEDERERLAKADGFDTVKAFTEFFMHQYGFPFEGVVIYW